MKHNARNGRQIVGRVGVDSGQILVIDPCYLADWKHGEFVHCDSEDRDDLTPANNYDECCMATIAKDAAPVFNKLAIVSSTGFGDGYYPVYATFEHGRVASLTIDFMDDSEDDNMEDDDKNG